MLLDVYHLTYRAKKCAGVGGHVPDKAAWDEREGKCCRKFRSHKEPPQKAKGKDKHVLSKCIVALMLNALPACTNVIVAMLSQGWANVPQDHWECANFWFY